MNRVFVTDGYWRKTLAVVRGLAEKDLKIGIGERTHFAPALFSRYAHRKYVYPSVAQKPAEFIDWLEKTVKKDKYDVLIIPEEETELLIAANKDKVEQFIKVAIPDYEKILYARDKFQVLKQAGKVRVSAPDMSCVSSFKDIKNNLDGLQYPLVLKPRIGTGARGIRYIHKNEDFEHLEKGLFEKHGDFLIQEYVPGDEYYGVSVIFNKKGKMRSAFVHRKIRQYPVTGGVSTYAVSVKYPELVELAERMLESIGWYGVANIEFKIDNRDNTPKLMEINPRLWGSLHLAVKSGINFPYLLYQLALTGDVDATFDYQEGVKLRWLIQGDLLSFISSLARRHDIDWEFFKFYEKDMHYAILSLSDPLPVLGKMLSLIDYCTSEEMRRFHD